MIQQIIFIKQVFISALIVTVLSVTTFVFFEPGLIRAQSATDSVIVTLVVDTGISITDGTNIAMSPNIGLATATSTGSTSWNVVTNDPQGYILAVRATGTPAMQQVATADTIADYTEATPGTPDAWNIPTASTTAEFGFSAYGTDVNTATYGTDSACESAPLTSLNRLYEGFSITDNTIATRPSTTLAAGITTTLCIAVEQAGGYQIPSGNYQAEIIATATVI